MKRLHAIAGGLGRAVALLTPDGRPAAAAADRPRLIDNSVETGITDCVTAAADAASKENLEGFIECFAARRRHGMRRQVALLFVTHAVSIELLDSQVVSRTEDRAELVVKYRFTRSDEADEVVSVISLTREDGGWKISGEKIECRVSIDRYGDTSDSGEQIFRFGGGEAVQQRGDSPRPGGGCANGRCGVNVVRRPVD